MEDLSCTYLAHHGLESVLIIIVIITTIIIIIVIIMIIIIITVIVIIIIVIVTIITIIVIVIITIIHSTLSAWLQTRYKLQRQLNEDVCAISMHIGPKRANDGMLTLCCSVKAYIAH